MADERETRLVKNTTVLTFGTMLTKGIMFIMTPLFTRWVSQESYGTFDLLVTYLNLIRPLVTLDLKDATFRYLAENEKGINDKEIISTSIIVHSICMAGCFMVSILISFFVPSKRYLILCFCILVVSETFFTLFTNISRGLKKIPIFATASILFTIGMAVFASVFVLVFNGGLYGLLLGYACGYILSFIYMLFANKVYRLISLKSFKSSVLKEMYGYAMPMLPNSVGWWIINVSDRTLVSFFLGTGANAILAVTSKLPNLCQQIFGQFSYSWQETSIESISSEDNDLFYSKIMNIVLKLILSITVLIMSMDFLYFKFLFSEEYFLGYYLIPVLLVAVSLSVVSQFFDGIYIAQMQSIRSGFTMTVAALINLIINLLLINVIGLWAAAFSTFCSQLALVVIRYCDLRKKIILKFDKEILAYILIAVYFTAGVYINNVYLNWLNLFLGFLCFVTLNLSYIKATAKKLKILKMTAYKYKSR